MRNVFLVDSYSKNTGDTGILLALLDALRDCSKAHIVAIESSHPDALNSLNDTTIQDTPIFPRIFDISSLTGDDTVSLTKKALSVIYGLLDSSTFLLWAIFYRTGFHTYMLLRPSRRSQAKALIETDIIWSVGGGFLSSNYNYIFRLYIQLVGRILKKKVVIFAQSIGPFDTKISRELIPYSLKRVDDLSVREPWSKKYLKDFKVNAILTNDIAFNLNAANTLKSGRPKTIAFCVKKGTATYDSALTRCMSYLIGRGYKIMIISQTPADDLLLDKYKAKLGSKRVVYIPYGPSPRDVKAMYSRCSLLISSRMHAIIFASSTGVPFISLAYEPKFKGLQQALDYPASMLIKEEVITYSKLLSVVQAAINDTSRGARLQSKISQIQQDNIKNIKRILEEV